MHIFLCINPAKAAAAPGIRDNENTLNESVPALKEHDRSLFISAGALREKYKHKGNIIIVDVRNRKEFQQFRIPGSINVPLHAIKTKSFLKSRPLVIADRGCGYHLLQKECIRLRGLGFKARILEGGLYLWRKTGGTLQGDPFKKNELNRMPPPVFFKEKDYANWTIIDLSNPRDPNNTSLLPRSIPVPLSDDTELFIERLKKSIPVYGQNTPRFLLLFNKKGTRYYKAEKALNGAGFKRAFFLKDGLEAYEKFLAELRLIRQPGQEKTVRSCTTCR